MTQNIASILFYDVKDKESKQVRALLDKARIPYHAVQEEGSGYPAAIETNNRIYSGVEDIRRYLSKVHGVA